MDWAQRVVQQRVRDLCRCQHYRAKYSCENASQTFDAHAKRMQLDEVMPQDKPFRALNQMPSSIATQQNFFGKFSNFERSS